MIPRETPAHRLSIMAASAGARIVVVDEMTVGVSGDTATVLLRARTAATIMRLDLASSLSEGRDLRLTLSRP